MTDAEKLELLLDNHVNLDLIYNLQRTYLDEDDIYRVYTSLVSYDGSMILKDEFYTVCEMLKG